MERSFGTLLARQQNDNENHFQKGLGAYVKNSQKRVSDNRKVYEVKGVLYVGVLLRYRCECLGMVLALIHPYIRRDFNTLKTHIQSLFS